MVDEFILKAFELMGAKLMASPARSDVYTLSNGSKVQLVNLEVVRYQVKGKKGGVISYSVVTARRIR